MKLVWDVCLVLNGLRTARTPVEGIHDLKLESGTYTIVCFSCTVCPVLKGIVTPNRPGRSLGEADAVTVVPIKKNTHTHPPTTRTAAHASYILKH